MFKFSVMFIPVATKYMTYHATGLVYKEIFVFGIRIAQLAIPSNTGA